jgi:lipoprotein-releasing system permease protein
MPYELTTALRYLLRSRSHKGFVSFFTFISVLCVLIGVGALIVVLSVMTGFERELKQKVIGVYAHITILGGGNLAVTNWHAPADLARQHPSVRSAAPYVTGPLLLSSRNRMRLLYILGTDMELESEVSELNDYLIRGAFPTSDDEIVLGDQAARQMGVRMGEKVRLTTAATARTPAGRELVPVHRAFTVVGFFHTGNYEYDANFSFVTLAAGQDLFKLGSAVHAVKLKLDHVDHASSVQHDLQNTLGPAYAVRTWMDQNPSLFSAVQMEKRVMFIILFLICVVAALNIVSTLVMVVLEKTKDIGILRSLGATKLSVGAIFTIQGLLIAVTGAALGITGGVLFAVHVDTISKFIERRTGFSFFPSNIYYLDAIPSVVVPHDVVVIAVSAIVLCLVASVFPAALAARLDPVEALRYE